MSPLLLAVVISAVAPVGGGNALTLPAQRHVARTSDGALLLAVQQDGQDGRGLGLYRSTDQGGSWRYVASIQNDWGHRDTADLVEAGSDVALVYGYEGPALSGSAAHDVYFQWWRGGVSPEPAVKVFDATASTTGYSRALLARDSKGRLWVHAMRLEADGGSTVAMAVSTDGGATFVGEPALDRTPARGGGRLLSLGTRMIMLYDGHDGTSPAKFRVRDDDQPVDAWQPVQVAFAEGIYHGAALSAVADGAGGMHLVYHDKNDDLVYRHFDGSGFGGRAVIQAGGDWTTQAATTLIGGDLYVFWNRPIALNTSYELRMRLVTGGAVGAVSLLDGSASFKGYLAAAATLPTSTASVPCFYGRTPDAESTGQVVLARVDRTPTGDPPPPPPTPPPPPPEPEPTPTPTPTPVPSAPGVVAPINAGNALTLPAQRHLVQLGATRFLALQQDGADGRGLGLYRSDDDGQTWNHSAQIQPDPSHRDTADLLAVGSDLALVYSFEGPEIFGSAAHDVYFQWWRSDGAGHLSPAPRVRVFNSTSSDSAYSRATLALDSAGRIWVQAFRLEADGGSTAVISVSTNGGATFVQKPALDRLAGRGGGRILSLGTRLIVLYDQHDGVSPAWFRVRNDTQSLGAWSVRAEAFPEGIYHGAALSAVADGAGGMHLVYKDKNEQLRYRRLTGKTFGPAQTVEGLTDWAVQGALTRVGAELVLFYNYPRAFNTDYELRRRRITGGVVGPYEVIESTAQFKGYPTAIESLPSGAATVPCAFGQAPDADSAGEAIVVRVNP